MTRAGAWLRRLLHSAPVLVLVGAAPPVMADDGVTVDGYGRVDGHYCALAARVVLDDGRRFEADASLAQRVTVEVRAATLAPPQCGQAPRLAGGIAVVPARPAIELTLVAREWPRHAGDVDTLMRRFAQARLRLRVLGSDAAEASAGVLRIATALLQQRPDVMARASIVALDTAVAHDAVAGWRVAPRCLRTLRERACRLGCRCGSLAGRCSLARRPPDWPTRRGRPRLPAATRFSSGRA